MLPYIDDKVSFRGGRIINKILIFGSTLQNKKRWLINNRILTNITETVWLQLFYTITYKKMMIKNLIHSSLMVMGKLHSTSMGL